VSKTIIFCADGTWNGPGQDEEQEEQGGHPTNVFKVFLNLAGDLAAGTLRSADEQERSLTGADGRATQIAKYLHGVGDSKNFLVRALGGGGGAGLVTRIVRGYTFISRNFEAGDRIFIIGFSRGAYTARALGGLIAARGLLDPRRNDLETDRAQAYRLGAAEWFTYRREALKGKKNVFQKLAEVAVDLPGFLQANATAPKIADVEIEAVVVWDTVGSLGIPAYNLRTDTQLDAFQFADLALSRKVRHGLHAVSVDEQRASFTPTLWDPDERITQVLFPGAHADVGGGYPQNESGLSDCALQWVVAELTALGVAFAPNPTVPLKPDACGMVHAPWAQAPWNLLPRGQRGLPAGLAVHRSVLDRLRGGDRLRAAGLALYQPESLADAYLSGGEIKPGVRIVG
jgi:uncharacterized protein (DUF2235 family)